MMTEQEFEDLVDAYGNALLEYETSQTCNSDTYVKQREAMYAAKNELLRAYEQLTNPVNLGKIDTSQQTTE